MTQVSKGSFLRKLLTALADDSPAFRAKAYPPEGGIARRLLVALADASPAFSRDAVDDSYSSAPVAPAASQPRAPKLSVLEYSVPDLSDNPLGARIAKALAPVFGGYAPAAQFSADTDHGLALAFVLGHPVALEVTRELAQDLASDIVQRLDEARRLETAFTDVFSPSVQDIARTRARNWAIVHRYALFNDTSMRLENPANLGIVQLLDDARLLYNLAAKNAEEGLLKSSGTGKGPSHLVDDAASDLLLAGGLASYFAQSAQDPRLGIRAHALARLIDSDIRQATTLVKGAERDLRGANLLQVDLAGADFSGVRWSTSTMWPPRWLSEVRRRSTEIGPKEFRVDDQRGGGGPSQSRARTG
jgi:hypothetical protein